MDITPTGLFTHIFGLVSEYAGTDTSAYSLAHRGYRAYTTSWDFDDRNPQPSHSKPIMGDSDKSWVVITTAILSAVIFALALYTLKVILTLCIIEDPPAIYLPVESEDPNERSRRPSETDTPKTYVTDSICGTIRYLRSEAGIFSAWRGFSASLSFGFATVIVSAILNAVFGTFLPQFIVRPTTGVLSIVLLARLLMTVTHIIISKNQPNTMWFSRVLSTSWSTTCRTIPAVAYFALSSGVSGELWYYSMCPSIHTGVRSAFVIISLFISLFVTFPMMVALIRVQASLLPDNQEGIVSFDRSFGKTDGTTGLSFGEALRSVGFTGWKRIWWLFMKIIGVCVAFGVVVCIIIGFEISWGL